MSIWFHSLSEKKYIARKTEIKNWIKKIISDHHKKLGNINIIFINDQEILSMNKKYLNHNFYTDILTFNYCSDKEISGDIYISFDRVAENAAKFNTSYKSEVLRVIIHGVLHLLGFDDKTKIQKNQIKQMEDDALLKFQSFRNN